jgi:hypothetical protein
MYYDRILTTEEALYVSRAQQRIAALAVIMAEEASRNDVNEYNAQLVVELEYSISILRSTDLAWSADDIRMMMDYYTLKGKLVTFPYRSIVFDPVNPIDDSKIWATVPQLREVETNSINYDAYLLSLINQEVIDRTDYDAYLLSLINLSAGGSLTEEVTAVEDIGGIGAGTVFPIGTLLQDIWIQLLSGSAAISNFTFNSYTPVIQVGVNLSITEFTWDFVGTPQNLVLNDSKGVLVDVPVSNGSVAVSLGYDWSVTEDLTWTLSGDNVEDIVIEVKRRYPSYYGKEATADDIVLTITEAKILAGTSYLQETSGSITVLANTATTEQGFIAVAKAQTGTSYTQWFVDNTNFSAIEAGEFIIVPIDVAVGGVTYAVYRWGYRSPLVNNIKLLRS